MKYIQARLLRIAALLLAMPFFATCVNSDLMDCSLAYVAIEPTDHTYNLPNLLYHFYDKNGRLEAFTYPCDGKGNFGGRLIVGDYWVVAANMDAENALFLDMENHETASVHARRIKIDTRHDTRSKDHYLSWPGDVYSVILGNLTVQGRDTIRLSPKPALLTRNISLKFKIGENIEREITGLSGELQGVYPSLNLFTCTPPEQDKNDLPTLVTRFAATGTGKEWQAQVGVLGLYDPEYGTIYRNVLSMTLFTSEGPMDVGVELTNLLSDIIKKNEGVIPIHVPIEITIQHEGILLVAEAKPWEYSGVGEGEVN